MNKLMNIAVVAVLVSIPVAGATTPAVAQESSWAELSLLGGIQVLNKNDTALPDRFISVPAVAALGYHVTPNLAIEGEFTWMVPVKQSVDLGSGTSQDLKTPDILAYQANVRATWPASSYVSPYLTAGAGGLTILSNTDADRLPQVDKSRTMLALNFGAGVNYGLNSRWAVRADFREFVAFPKDDATGLSNGSTADEIWMERGTLGVAYRF